MNIPMNVAFFVDDFPSITQTFVLRQIAGVMAQGWPVVIYAHRDNGLSGAHRLFDEFNMTARTIYLPPLPRSRTQRLIALVKVCSKPETMRHLFKLARSLNFFRYGGEAASLRLFLRSIPFLNSGPFDILHSQFGWLGAAACRLRQIGVLTGKVVTSFRGYDTEQYLKQKPDAYRHLFRNGDLFLPVCDYFKTWLIANGCPEDKIEVLRSGIDLKEFAFRVRKLGDPGTVRLLSVARMREKKGLRYALQAVAMLRRAGRDVHYTILGDGPQRDDLLSLAGELGIGQYVSMPGAKPHKEVVAIMERSDILLAPSITASDGDHEGIPNVLKEAMATGMPVIGTYHSGIPELVIDQKTGFLVPEKDAEAIEHRVTALLDHPEAGAKMGKAGRAMVEREYDIDRLNRRLIELYRGLYLKQECRESTTS